MSNQNATGDVMLEAVNVVKEYVDGQRHIDVLTGVDLKVYRGKALAILGKSGAGKSTLLHMLGLIDTPSSGSVLLDGKDVTLADAKEQASIRNKRYGFVFQAYHLIPELTALENILLPAMMRGVWEWRAAKRDLLAHAHELLEAVGLVDRSTHRPQKLSGGERQRVAIARALINEPDALFCDEPTGNLDEVTSKSVNQLLTRLRSERGLTQVIVTHDKDLAAQADTIVRIERGKVVHSSGS